MIHKMCVFHMIFAAMQKTMFSHRQILHSVLYHGEAVLGDEGGENAVNLLYLIQKKKKRDGFRKQRKPLTEGGIKKQQHIKTRQS